MSDPWQANLDAAVRRRSTGEAAAALSEFLTLAAAWPDAASVQYHTAWCHDLLGREAEAVPFYERALAILTAGVAAFPADRGLQTFQAMAWYNAGQAKDAVSQLLTLLVATTTDPAIRQYAKAITLYAEDLDRTWS